MKSKVFEVRDRATFISVLATQTTDCETEIEANHFYRNGFSPVLPHVFLTRICDAQTQYDPYAWGERNRTMLNAHLYIVEHFDDLASGSVVDVEFILGETTEPKESEFVAIAKMIEEFERMAFND